jgi:O-acetyl-ADP-ribose deacetylase (regulator of RNase III)
MNEYRREVLMKHKDPTSPRITFVIGDLTEQHVDAVVNAANSSLLGGGGVDGAIHRKGGAAILAECRMLRATTLPGGLPPGEAVATTGGELPARRVIHTVGPVWRGGSHGEAETLRRAYTSALEIANAEGLTSIAFPSVSTGAYGYPVRNAAIVALDAVSASVRSASGASESGASSLREIRFVLHSRADHDVYVGEWKVREG